MLYLIKEERDKKTSEKNVSQDRMGKHLIGFGKANEDVAYTQQVQGGASQRRHNGYISRRTA